LRSLGPRTPLPAWTPDLKPRTTSRSNYRLVAIGGVVTVALIAIVGIGGWFMVNRMRAAERTVAVETPPLPEQVPAAGARRAGSRPDRSLVDSQQARASETVAGAGRNALSDGAVPLPAGEQSSGIAAPLGPGGDANATSANRANDLSQSEDIVAIRNALAALTAGGGSPRSILAPPAGAAPGPFTYGEDDPDVIPPAAVDPQLLRVLRPNSPGVRLDALTIAVVVNPDGSVESVRGVNAPLNIGESMLLTSALSVVKTWHFVPAIKDGTPVRYRKIVPLRQLTRQAN
jgi:hypothetical protein